MTCHKNQREQKTGRQLKPTYPQIPQEYLTLVGDIYLEKLKYVIIVALLLHTVRYNKEKSRETLKYER